MADVITNATVGYVKEVKELSFPDEDKYCYRMVIGEEVKLIEIVKKQVSNT